MHFVLDLDDTLLNSNVLWKEWSRLLLDAGYEEDRIAATIESVIIDGFTPEKHALRLGADEKQARHLANHIRAFTEEFAPSFVFEDVVPFLEIHKQKNTLSLLTYGNAEYQQEKLRAAKLHTFFEHVRIAGPHKLKVRHLEELSRHSQETIVFVDDSPNQLRPVANAELPVRLYRIFRNNAKHTDSPHELDGIAWTCISSLSEIE